MKRRRLLVFVLSLCMIFNGVSLLESSAAEADDGQATQTEEKPQVLEDENQTREDSVTSMDVNSNIEETGDADGSMEDDAVKAPATRSMLRSAVSTPYVVNFNTKNNETTSYTEYITGKSGYTNGDYGADAAYLGTENGKVKFMLSGVIGLVSSSQVEVIPLSKAAVVSGYYVSNGRLIHGIVCDMTTPGYRTTLDNGEAPSYLKSGTTYYSYDGHYFYTNYATMLGDYQSGTRANSVNPKSPYYNYYQYLPMRSTTSYSSSTLNSMINSKVSSSSKMYNIGSTIITNQNTYGVNGLLMAGIAANESGWGSSSICQSKNNLFGLNAVDSSPGTSAYTFASVSACIQDFANGWMSRGYLDPRDWRYEGGFLGNKGSGINVSYASDPYWGEKAANVAYTLDKTQGSKDYDRYTIAIKDTINSSHETVNVRNGASTSNTKVLYTTGSTSNYSVLVLDDTAVNSFYKIQSDGVLNSERTALASGSGQYSFDKMYAYISSDYVEIVNNGSYTAEPEPEPEPVTLSSISIATAPAKTSYTEGEKFDASGMKVTAKWSNGTTTDVSGSVSYSTAALKTTDTSVTISYTSGGVTKTASQAITVKTKVTVSEVKINPSEISLEQGSSKTFGVSVTGTGSPSQKVTWSVAGNKSGKTSIDENGKLTIGEDETAETLTVKAVSAVDTGKSATAEVRVTAKVQEKPDEVQLDDEKTGMEVSASFGDGVDPEEVELTVETIEEKNEVYETLVEPVSDMKILGVYDVSLSETAESITLTFDIGEEYDGKDVTILHYSKADDTTYVEKYVVTAENGKVTVKLDSLSPIVLAVSAQENDNDDVSGSDSVTLPEDDALIDGSTGQDGDTDAGNGNNGIVDNTSENAEDPTVDSVNNGSTGNSEVESDDLNTSNSQSVEGENGSSDEAGTASSEAASQNDESTATGDDFQIGLWIILATAAALGGTVLVLTRKKKAND